MARPHDDEQRPALLALGALVLGVGAVIAIWSAGRSDRRTAGPDDEGAPGWSVLGSEPSPHGLASASDAGIGALGTPLGASPMRPWAGGAIEASEGDVEDPQMLAMRRSFGEDAGMAAAFSPYLHAGRAIVVAGVDGVADRASCDVRVLPVRSPGGFNCVVRVRCGGVTVYPDSALEAGYAPCEIEGGVPRLATDRAPTDRDGDPELLVDVGSGRVRVHDVRHGSESTVEILLD
jgi:hypothetical protein